MNKTILTVALLLISLSAFSQSAPKYSNEFLSIGVSARGLAMAGSQTALTNDVTSAYWNPAGLLNIKEKYQLALTHSAYFGGVANYDYAGFSTTLDESGQIAFSVIRMGVDDIPDTRFMQNPDGSFDFTRVGSFAEASYAFLFSYARRNQLIKGLRTGANFKVIHRSVGIFANSWGFGVDLGAQYERGKWRFGAMARDITSTFNVWNYNTEALAETFAQTGNELSNNRIEITLPRLMLDVSRQVDIGSLSVTASAGLESTFDGKRNTLICSKFISADPRGALELGYKQQVFVRAGIGSFQQISDFDDRTYTSLQPNFGVGFNLKNFTIDYALTNPQRKGAGMASHVISLRVNFNSFKPKS